MLGPFMDGPEICLRMAGEMGILVKFGEIGCNAGGGGCGREVHEGFRWVVGHVVRVDQETGLRAL